MEYITVCISNSMQPDRLQCHLCVDAGHLSCVERDSQVAWQPFEER